MGQHCSKDDATEAGATIKSYMSAAGSAAETAAKLAGSATKSAASRGWEEIDSLVTTGETKSGRAERVHTEHRNDCYRVARAEAEQKKAEQAVPKEVLQFIEDTGDYMTKVNNEKEHHTIYTWLKVALRFAYRSPALKESIKRLLAVNKFTGNMKYM